MKGLLPHPIGKELSIPMKLPPRADNTGVKERRYKMALRVEKM